MVRGSKVHVRATENTMVNLSQEHEKRRPVIHSFCSTVDRAKDVPFTNDGIEMVFAWSIVMIAYVWQIKGPWLWDEGAVLDFHSSK